METVTLRTGPGEPPVARWEVISASQLAVRVASLTSVEDRPAVVGIDGRSGGGKSTAADVLVRHLPSAQVLHTDDVAWYQSMFGWDELLARHVLGPLRQGADVHYRPPAWDERGRAGALSATGRSRYVVVEGCGATRRSLEPFLDARIWVQSDHAEAERRGILRDGGTEAAAAFWREWQSQETPFFLDDRPWERADLVLCGTPGDLPADHWLVAADGGEIHRRRG